MKLLLTQQLLETISPPLLFFCGQQWRWHPLKNKLCLHPAVRYNSHCSQRIRSPHAICLETRLLPAWKLAWLLLSASKSQVGAGGGMREDGKFGDGSKNNVCWDQRVLAFMELTWASRGPLQLGWGMMVGWSLQWGSSPRRGGLHCARTEWAERHPHSDMGKITKAYQCQTT